MLGLGRASQYAGWWNQDTGTRSMEDTLTFVFGSGFRVNDRYYWDATGMTVFDTYDTLYSAIANDDTINFSGTKNYKLQLHAVQFRAGADWGKDGSGNVSTDYYGLLRCFVRWDDANDTDQQFDSIAIDTQDGAYRFSISGYSGINNIDPADVPRDTWLTLLAGTSDDYTDFADWTGPTTNTYNRFGRIMLLNAETGQVLYKEDQGGFNDFDYQPDLNNPWDFTYTNGIDRFSQFALMGYNNDYTYNPQDMYVSQEYHAYGEFVDPATVTNTFCGLAWPSEISGAKALFNLQLPEAGTAVGTPVWAYDVTNDITGQYAGTYEIQGRSDSGSGSPTPPVVTLNTRIVDL